MKLMILDGNSIVNRAFYGMPPLNAPDGTPTNAILGFLNIMNKLLEEQKPDALCVSFDLKAPTFRHEAYADYKAGRKPMPDELAVQMPLLKKVLDAMGIMRYELEGYEADDILGTVAAKCENLGWSCVIVTGDKDSLQLISESTEVCNVKTRMGKTETICYTPQLFFDEYGFAAEYMVDLKALMGDSSDNIPGVAGIGEKTAKDLIRRFNSLEAVYSNISSPDIKEGTRKKLIAGEESAKKSYWLATIKKDIPLDFEPSDNIWNNSYKPELYDVMLSLGFRRIIEKWGLEKNTESVKEDYAVLPNIEVCSREDILSLIDTLSACEYVSIALQDKLAAIEICDGKTVYNISPLLAGEEYNRLLSTVFTGIVKKVAENVKDIMRILISEGLPADGFIFDTALADYLIDVNDSDHSAERASLRTLGRKISGTQAIFELYPAQNAKLDELNLTGLYYDIELPLCLVLAEMEDCGFLVDRKALGDFSNSLNAEIEVLQKRIYAYAGHEFNINSPKQLGEVLFEELMLPSGKKTKSGWSTSADILEKLRGKHPIISDILEYRTLTKLKSTYADGLIKVIDPNDGRIHTSFQMTVTATGRLSSTEPNLQNIPIRKEQGAQIRKMFVPEAGKLLIDADYSQIELRLLAHISGDKAMQEAFLSGEDFHAHTASRVFNLPLEDVTPLLRSRAKAVNFGIVYGISAFSLAQDIGVTQSEAKQYMDAYLDKYSGVRDYMKNIVASAKEKGYVETLFGRRRYLPELKSSNFNVRSFGERVALNMPIQGTAADIIKLAMVNVHKAIKQEGLKARMILQVHDELIVECPKDEAEKLMQILEHEMENVVSYAVPLIAEAHSGKSWAEAH